MKLDNLGSLVARIVDNPLSPATISLNPATGSEDEAGYLVFSQGCCLRVEGREYGHSMYEQFLGGKFLAAAGGTYGGARDHTGSGEYSINVGFNVRIGIRRVGEWCYVGLARWYRDRNDAAIEAQEQRQACFFNLLPAPGVSSVVRASSYGDYRMAQEPTLATIRTDLAGHPLD